jgi:hypothetical protein
MVHPRVVAVQLQLVLPLNHGQMVEYKDNLNRMN